MQVINYYYFYASRLWSIPTALNSQVTSWATMFDLHHENCVFD